MRKPPNSYAVKKVTVLLQMAASLSKHGLASVIDSVVLSSGCVFSSSNSSSDIIKIKPFPHPPFLAIYCRLSALL